MPEENGFVESGANGLPTGDGEDSFIVMVSMGTGGFPFFEGTCNGSNSDTSSHSVREGESMRHTHRVRERGERELTGNVSAAI